MKLLSVIIPTYNMEKYLDRCISSFVACENRNLLELVVVNDGSKDSSSEIAHRYADEFPDVVKVIDKKNGHYGSCINVALPILRGKYTRIVDSDDWVSTEGLNTLLTKLHSLDVDIVFTDYECVYEKSGKVCTKRINGQKINEVISIDDNRLSLLNDKEDLKMHHMTYRTQLLLDSNYRQTEGVVYTDTEYVFYPLMRAKTVTFFDIVLYQYMVGREEQSIALSSRLLHTKDYYPIINRMMENTFAEISETHGRLLKRYVAYVLACLYHNLLVLQPLTDETRNALVSLDEKVKIFDADVYEILNGYRCMYLRYIYIWRKWNVQCVNPWLYHKLFKLLN